VIASLLVGLALAAPCPAVSSSDLAQLAPPAVLVLKERHGDRGDLRRARRVIRKLARRGPVALALEAAHEDNQPALDRFQAGELGLRELREALRWSETWGFPWRPYRRLFALHRRGVQLVAAGLTLGPAPDDREVPIPDGYDEVLAAVLAAHGGTPDTAMKARFARSMAWRDLRIGELALGGFDGRGVLVILTGRGHVEGGRGTPWQLRRLGAPPVHTALLAQPDGACEPGDRVLGR